LAAARVPRRVVPSVPGVPGATGFGATPADPLVPVAVPAPDGAAAPGVVGVAPGGVVVAGAEPPGVAEPGATVPGCAPDAAGVLLVVAVVAGPWTRADCGTVIFVPGTVGVAAAEATDVAPVEACASAIASASVVTSTSATAGASFAARRAVADAPPVSADPCIVADGNERAALPRRSSLASGDRQQILDLGKR
jgi:hypothetical protein